MIRIPKFATIFKGKPKRDEAELDELLETCGGDMWAVMREYKKRHPKTSIKGLRNWIGVDDEDLDIKDAWNDELFLKVWGKPRTEFSDK